MKGSRGTRSCEEKSSNEDEEEGWKPRGEAGGFSTAPFRRRYPGKLPPPFRFSRPPKLSPHSGPSLNSDGTSTHRGARRAASPLERGREGREREGDEGRGGERGGRAGCSPPGEAGRKEGRGLRLQPEHRRRARRQPACAGPGAAAERGRP